MKTIATNIIRLLTLQSLTGPIFSKELRIASRRKRFYWLRGLYLIALMIVMALIWAEAVGALHVGVAGTAIYRTSRMAEASRIIITAIAWFQFVAAQLAAVVMCSTAINAEIHRRTLYVLMTTPITSRQLVVGKLAGRLWQIVGLVLVSLPLLAIMRVFGGISAGYLIETFCVTLCTVFLLSALTIFYSIYFRRPYVVILFTVITAGVVMGLIPLGIFAAGEALDDAYFDFFSFDYDAITAYMNYSSNPYFWMFFRSSELFITPTPWYWIFSATNCSLLLAGGVAILWVTCRKVRSAALKRIQPKSHRKKYKMPPRKAKTYWLQRPIFMYSLVERTIGTGMIWKEFLQPVLGRFRKPAFGLLIGWFSAIMVSLVVAIVFESLEFMGFLLAGAFISLAVLAVLFTVIIPATYITAEKEAGTWLVLLTTCYTDWQILGGKIIGILRRIGLVWLPFLLIFYIVCAFVENPWTTFFQTALAVLVGIVFVVASGLYLSSRLKHTTTAVVCNLVLVPLLWAGLPLLVLVLPFNWLAGIWPWEIFQFTPCGIILVAFNKSHLVDGVVWIVFCTLHLATAGLFLWRAKANLRKRIC